MRRLLVVVLALVLLAALLSWAIAGPVLRLAIEQAAAASGGRLRVDGVRGTLFEPLTIERLVVRDGPPESTDEPSPGGSTWTLEALRVHWRPLALAGGAFHVVDASVARAELRQERSDEPSKPPDSLAIPLPVRLRVDRARVDALRVVRPDGATVDVGPIALEGGRYAHGGYAVERLAASTPWGAVEVSGRLDDAPPYALDAQVRARAPLPRVGDGSPAREVALAGTLRGPLERIAVDVRATPEGPAPARDAAPAPESAVRRLLRRRPAPAPAAPAAPPGADAGTIALRTVVTPFVDGARPTIDASFDGLDLRAWGIDLRTALAGTATVTPGAAPEAAPGAAPEPAPDARAGPPPGADDGFAISGTVAATNAAPGLADARALPLTALDARFRWQDGKLQIDDLVARTPGDGEIAGAATIDPARDVVLPWFTMPWTDFDARVRGVDLASIASVLPRAVLAGRVAGQGPRFDVDVDDATRPGLGVAGAGTLEPQALVVERATLRGPYRATVTVSGTAALRPPYALDLQGGFERLDPPRIPALVAMVSGLARTTPPPPADRPDVPSGVDAALARLPGAISGRWALRGPALGAQAPAKASAGPLRVQASIDDGTLAGLRAHGTVDAALALDRISEVLLDVRLGATTLEARGALGAPGDRLAFAARAGALAPLAGLIDAPPLAGSLVADGALQGTLAAPAMTVQARGSNVAVGDVFAARTLTVAAELPQFTGDFLDAKVALRVDGADLRAAGTPVRSLSVRVDGTARAHTLRVEAEGAQLGGRLAGSGGFALPLRWSGTLDELVATGKVPLRLAAPVEIAWAPGELRASSTVIDSAYGSARVGRAAWRDGRIELVVDATLQRLGQLLAVLGVPVTTAAQDAGIDALTLDVHVDVAGTGTADASGRVVAKLRPTAGAPGAASRGVAGNGDLEATLRDGRVDGTMAVVLPTLAFVNRTIGPEWAVDGQVGFDGRVGGTVAAPRLVGAVFGERLALDQRSMGWRLRDGRLAGRFDGERFVLEGLTFRSAATAQGSVSLSGEVLVATGAGRFELAADRLAVPIGPGQRIVVTGTADVKSTESTVEVTGRLRADEGRIELAGGDAPSMPDDIVIRPSRRAGARAATTTTTTATTTTAATGTTATSTTTTTTTTATTRPADAPAPQTTVSTTVTTPAAGAAAATPAAPGEPPLPTATTTTTTTGKRARLVITSDVSLDLGDGIRVYGSGVDALVVGSIRLRGRLPEAPRAFGTVRVRDGEYSAYGQQLDIVRGVVTFNGPLDNPVLDILALRRNQAVEAGVALTGTVLSPRVRLASRPEVPDAEKLSWLVLGVPLDSAQSRGQGAALQAAAASLLGRNDGSLGGSLASRFGLDILSIRSAGSGGGLLQSAFGGGLGGAALPPIPGQVGVTTTSTAAGVADKVVTVGKRLSPRLFVTYEQGLRGVWNLLQIQYDISRRLALRAQTGSESAVDLLYTVTFD